MAGTTPGEHTQVIVLLVDREHPADDRDGISVAAFASAHAFVAAPDVAVWETWLSEAMAKSVRRADAKTFEKLRVKYRDVAVHDVLGDAEALAFLPMPNDALPKDVARLQVSGTTLPRRADEPLAEDSDVEVLLNADIGMSTGKAAAQAAHAFWLHVAQGYDTDGAPRIRFASLPELEAAQTKAAASSVVDAGRTEIEPGSLTAVAHFRRGF